MKMDQLIDMLMEQRGLSLTEFSKLLGYQSKTSLSRVRANQISKRALDGFVKRLEERLDLTKEERFCLSEALEQLQWQEDYGSSKEMRSFLRGEKPAEESLWLEDAAGGWGKQLFVERYAAAKDVHVVLLNSQYVSVFGALLKLVREQHAEVEHFLLVEEDPIRVIRAMNAVIPLMYERNYMCYSWLTGVSGEMPQVQGMLNSDVMVISYTDQHGADHEEMIVFDRPNHGVLCSGEPGSFCRMLSIPRERFRQIKQTYSDDASLDNYVRFSAYCANLERDTMVYMIKPDVSIDWISVDILLSALVEGGVPGFDPSSELISSLYAIYAERGKNTFEKRRITRSVLKRSAMLRFARTGRMSDHFWGMRPFTSAERVAILRRLLDEIENNPYFNVCFLKENDELRDVVIMYFEDKGLLLLDSATDYFLAEGHSEVMILHPEFMRLFKEYFERVLLNGMVTTQRETVRFMRGLIAVAEGKIDDLDSLELFL